MNIPELLIPAGDLEKLKTAIRFGADAVYVGGDNYSLRARNSSMSLEELERGIKYAHERSAKVYLALNIFPYDADIIEMIDYLEQAVKLGIDAVIVADPGMLQEVQQRSLGIKIHLSTQANTINSRAVQFWANQGVQRIVLARELNLLQISEIKKNNPLVELEAFIHGAMCMAYSGRCLLSSAFTNRSANRGECAQPCRWQYYLREAEDPKRELKVNVEEYGTYIMNAKDLCMIEYIPELVSSGLDSFKIEGRMKSAYYVALITKIYRTAIDQFCVDPENYQFKKGWLAELKNLSHRPYSTGFYHNNPEQYEESSKYIKKYNFVGVVREYDLEKKEVLIQVRNQIKSGDIIEVLDPHQPEILSFKADNVQRENGEVLQAAHNQYVVKLKIFFEISPNSILRIAR
jgi:U32 family peptidase